MEALKAKIWLGKNQTQIMDLMFKNGFIFLGDSRTGEVKNIPTVQYSFEFMPPNNHPALETFISFYENIAIAISFSEIQPGIIEEWIKMYTEIVPSPKFLPLNVPSEIKRILRKDKDFWYNIRITPNHLFGVTITNRQMFP